MMKKTMATCGALLLLAACPSGNNEPSVSQEVRELAECRHPAVLPDIRDNLRQTIRREAQYFASHDKRHFVDADKVTAAADRLQVRMQSVRADSPMCTAQISVIIPQTILDTAERYAPILENTSPAEIILNRTTNNNLRFDGQAVMAELTYRVNSDNQHFAVNYADGNLSLLGNVIASALLSYGVKDIIMVNGKAISRDTAANNMNREPTVQVIRPQEVEPLTPPPAPVPPNNATLEQANSTTDKQQSSVPTERESRISSDQLENAKNDHETADRDIKQAWQNIDPTIQQSLISDQQEWENKKNNLCIKAAAKGNDGAESQYLQIKCDIRETQKRIKYLNGYSIP